VGIDRAFFAAVAIRHGLSQPMACAAVTCRFAGLAHRNVIRGYSESICSLEGGVRFAWIHFASGNVMNPNLQRRLKAHADNFKGPLGPIPLDRAVRRHRDLFEEFRDEGFTWSQIARALAAAGIRRADGSSFSADRLRGAVSRQMKVKASASTGRFAENTTPLRTAVRAEQTSSKSRTAKTAQPEPGSREATHVKPSGAQRPDRPTVVARSIQDKLARVAKLRGG